MREHNDSLEDTDRIQKAIEKVMDDDTSTLPLIPVPGIPASEPEESDEALPPDHPEPPPELPTRTHRWFFTFMCMNIPVAGWIYLLYLAFNKKVTDRRDFARAYLFYKLIFFIISAVILGMVIYIGMGFLNQLLTYMEML